ncbi:uncharacterized protein LOC118277076 [Spodoptera frugiperda]|uniref:Uncharacterized protein LOC118277076 n=1 Tax=Spodoptera frugiperda TaxID=7108 RepID=A0A9R0DFR2_SPOFR|nr:uncharacterized protein LOC118277076 [Spodoptera frugiperda]
MSEEETIPSSDTESQRIEEEFIKTYKNLPVLWDTTNNFYTNKYKRNEAVDVLVDVLKKSNPSANRYSVRKKINSLRCSFRKDLIKHLSSKRINENGEEIYEYKPTNWKFYELRFLEREDDSSLTEVRMDDSAFLEVSADELAFGHEICSSPVSDVLATNNEPARKRNKSKKILKSIKLEEVDTNEYHGMDGDDHDLIDRELEAVGANVTCKLKRMNPLQRYHAELLINKVLISGLKNNLTDDTDLTDIYRP